MYPVSVAAAGRDLVSAGREKSGGVGSAAIYINGLPPAVKRGRIGSAPATVVNAGKVWTIAPLEHAPYSVFDILVQWNSAC